MQAEINNFCIEWSSFTQDNYLVELSSEYKTWTRIFKRIAEYVNKQTSPAVMVFDEVQWIAKKNSGFLSALKEAWIDLQQSGKAKLIICGSSRKFFIKNLGGGEKILRGLQTRPHLWVLPLSMAQTIQYVVPTWKINEAAILYMLTGGVPYYLERVDGNQNFISAINDGYFLQENNLLDEIDEILNLEFGPLGKRLATQILSHVGILGTTQSELVKRLSVNKSSVSRIVNQLQSYDLLAPTNGFKDSRQYAKKNQKFYIPDFFINAFYSIFKPSEHLIRANKRGMIFPSVAGLSKKGYYMSNFTGRAFEYLVRYHLENRALLSQSFKDKLQLRSENYSVLEYEDSKNQIDLMLVSQDDREIRCVECCWGIVDSTKVEDVKRKTFQFVSDDYLEYSVSKYLISSMPVTKGVRERALELGVRLVGFYEIL